MLCVKLFMGKSCSTPEVKTVNARSRRTVMRRGFQKFFWQFCQSEHALVGSMFIIPAVRGTLESRIGLLPDSTRILSSSVLSAVWPTSLESQSLIK